MSGEGRNMVGAASGSVFGTCFGGGPRAPSDVEGGAFWVLLFVIVMIQVVIVNVVIQYVDEVVVLHQRRF